MRCRRFGKTGWQVSEIALGGAWFHGRPEFGPRPVSHGAAIVERALELGVNYIDTAPLYGSGRSEEVLGHALKGVKQPFFLATKVGYLPEPFDYTRDTVMRGFEASLRRLQRDRVDLVQIHETEKAGWEGVFGKGRTLEALVELREQGLATHIGLTGADLDLMVRMLGESRRVRLRHHLPEVRPAGAGRPPGPGAGRGGRRRRPHLRLAPARRSARLAPRPLAAAGPLPGPLRAPGESRDGAGPPRPEPGRRGGCATCCRMPAWGPSSPASTASPSWNGPRRHPKWDPWTRS